MDYCTGNLPNIPYKERRMSKYFRKKQFANRYASIDSYFIHVRCKTIIKLWFLNAI